MPRKRTSGDNGEPVERRASSRIASLPRPDPEPKPELSNLRKRKSNADDVVEIVPIDDDVVTTPRKRGRPSKKSISSPETIISSGESIPEPITVIEDEPKALKVADAEHDNGFEVVKKDSIPSPTSNEVKKAIDAQGCDGQLLVNFVQVSKEDLPSPDSDVIKELAKQAEGDNKTVCTKKPVVEDVIKETLANPGCNGNCETTTDHSHDVSNGVATTPVESSKNGSHEMTTSPMA